MSWILSWFGYETYNLEVSIYNMAELMDDLDDHLKAAGNMRKYIVRPWEMIMQIWSALLTIAAFIYVINLSVSYKPKPRDNPSPEAEMSNSADDEKNIHLEEDSRINPDPGAEEEIPHTD